jgi:uncharacterized membrane protein YeaQ/YmgE (transglycosylase-associated protein family)
MQELLRFLLVGFAAGWIAQIAVHGKWRIRGCLPSIAVGVTGALVGGYLVTFMPLGEVAAVVGAGLGSLVALRAVRRLREM